MCRYSYLVAANFILILSESLGQNRNSGEVGKNQQMWVQEIEHGHIVTIWCLRFYIVAVHTTFGVITVVSSVMSQICY